MTKKEWLAILRWEVPVNLHSDLEPAQAMASLQAMASPPQSKSFFKRFFAVQPFAGRLRQGSGVLRQTDYGHGLRGPVMRELHFSIEPDISGSRLQGRLQLRLGLCIYEVFALTAAACFEAMLLYRLFAASFPDYKRIAVDLLRPFLVFPFLWCYVRLGLWLGRKREAELLTSVKHALAQPSKPAAISAPPRRHIPSRPTEVFIPPRKP